jgi:cold shock CspA family protein
MIQFSTGATVTGTVKWLDSTKGCGFLQPDRGGKRVFIHISSVELGSNLTEGREGRLVSNKRKIKICGSARFSIRSSHCVSMRGSDFNPGHYFASKGFSPFCPHSFGTMSRCPSWSSLLTAAIAPPVMPPPSVMIVARNGFIFGGPPAFFTTSKPQ